MEVVLQHGHIHAEHFLRKVNVRMDWGSQHGGDSSNWTIGRAIFQQLEEELGPFTIDLFASQTNALLPTYCSWKPDQQALVVDAQSILWQKHLHYMLSLFVWINRCLDKIREEEVDALMLPPIQQNQARYPIQLYYGRK